MTSTTSRVPYVEVPRPDQAAKGARLRVVHVPPAAISEVRVAKLPLRMHSYDDTFALPVVRMPRDRFRGAVYDKDGRLIGATQRPRPGPRWRSNPEQVEPPVLDEYIRLRGRTFFGGQLNYSFGHVLLETLARFWRPLEYRAYDHVVLYPNVEPTNVLNVRELTRDALELVGVSGPRIRVVDRRPLKIDHLDVSQSPIRLGSVVDRRLMDVFDRVARDIEATRPAVHAAARVYLSRRRLSEDHRHATNEDEIEAMLTAHGFVIVHPQEMSLVDQVLMARQADIIAGCDGSALHVAAFARPGAKLLALDSRRTPNQLLIGWARGLDAVHVRAWHGQLDDRNADWTADLARVQDALDLCLADG